MNCKVCGNAVNNIDKVCNVCGNNIESQRREEAIRREEARRGHSTARQESFNAPPQAWATSLMQEKDEAISRIFGDDDTTSARDRLEERRKKRQEERSKSGTGLSALFSPPNKVPLKTTASQREDIDSGQAPEEKPLRKFSTEFVFGSKQKQEAPPETQVAEPMPAQQTFVTPAPEGLPAVPAYEPPAPAFEPPVPEYKPPAPVFEPLKAPEATQPADSFFTMTPSEEEQAKFKVDKKTEEFQELLDKEFERMQSRDTVTTQPQLPPAVEPEAVRPEVEAKSYIEERVDAFLKQSDLEIAIARRARGEEARQKDPVQELTRSDRQEEPYVAPVVLPPVILPPQAAPPAYESQPPAVPQPQAAPPAYEPQAPIVPQASAVTPPAMPQPPAYIPHAYESQPSVVPQPPARQHITPWGATPNVAPTRESIKAFIDRPIDFPFDEKPEEVKEEKTVVEASVPEVKAQAEAESPYKPKTAFDFEPIEKVVEKAAELAEPVGEESRAEEAALTQPTPAIQPHEEAAATLPAYNIPAPISETPEKSDEPQPQDEPSALKEAEAIEAAAAKENLLAQEEQGTPEAQESPTISFVPAFAAPFAATPQSSASEPAKDAEGAEAKEEPQPQAASAAFVPHDYKPQEAQAAPAAYVPRDYIPQTVHSAYVPRDYKPLADRSAHGSLDPAVAQTPEASAPVSSEKEQEAPVRDFVSFITEPSKEEPRKTTPEPAAAPVTAYASKAPETAEQSFAQPAGPLVMAAGNLYKPEEARPDSDTDAPPQFYKEYTQGHTAVQPEKAKEEPAIEEKQQTEAVEAKSDTSDTKVSRVKSKQKSETKQKILSVIITILIIILVIIVACIIVLKVTPDSSMAYYIQDFIETLQGVG